MKSCDTWDSNIKCHTGVQVVKHCNRQSVKFCFYASTVVPSLCRLPVLWITYHAYNSVGSGIGQCRVIPPPRTCHPFYTKRTISGFDDNYNAGILFFLSCNYCNICPFVLIKNIQLHCIIYHIQNYVGLICVCKMLKLCLSADQVRFHFFFFPFWACDGGTDVPLNKSMCTFVVICSVYCTLYIKKRKYIIFDWIQKTSRKWKRLDAFAVAIKENNF